MSRLDDLAVAYKTHENSLLAQWRVSVNTGKGPIQPKAKETKFNRRLRNIFPRGKVGEEIKDSLTYYTV